VLCCASVSIGSIIESKKFNFVIEVAHLSTDTGRTYYNYGSLMEQKHLPLMHCMLLMYAANACC